VSLWSRGGFEGEGEGGVRSRSAEWNGKGRGGIGEGMGEFIGKEEEEGEGIEDQVEVGEENHKRAQKTCLREDVSVCDFGCVLGFPFLYWHRRPASSTITIIQKMICRDIHFPLSTFIHSILPRTHLTSESYQLLYLIPDTPRSSPVL